MLQLSLICFFADDSLLFFRATISESTTVQSILRDYEKAFGQSINYQKSTNQFSHNVNDQVSYLICQHLNAEEEDGKQNYLGLPYSIGTNKTEAFSYLKDKVW